MGSISRNMDSFYINMGSIYLCIYLIDVLNFQVYTLKIFKYFQKEFSRSFETNATLSMDLGDKKLYDVIKEDDLDDVATVMFIKHPTGRIEISCGCRHFEEVGWLCKHCLRILDKHDIKRIPDEYILQRWTKTLKEKVWDRVLRTKSTNVNAEVKLYFLHKSMFLEILSMFLKNMSMFLKMLQECIAWRQKMNRRYTEMTLKSEGNQEARKILEDGYKRDMEAILSIINTTKFPERPQEQAPDSPNTKPASTSAASTTTEQPIVLDPQIASTKGRKKERFKNKFERKGKKPKTTEFVAPPPDKYLL